jgi:hypothetical protein
LLTDRVFSGLILLMCPFLPDSPRLLIRKGQYDEAYEVLAALEGHGATVNSSSVRTQFSIIKDVLDKEYAETYTWWQLITGKGPAGVLRRMILGAWMQAMNQSKSHSSSTGRPKPRGEYLKGLHSSAFRGHPGYLL